jgi:hypothetical protein
MERRFLIFAAAMTLFVPLLLVVDGDGLQQQFALGATTVAFLWICTRSSPVPRAQIVCAIAIATLGEVILSVGWGLYSYQHALIPFYVPPGHGLFYALAAEAAQQQWLRRHERVVTRAVLIVGTLIAVASLAALDDTWGFLWWLGALALIRFSRNPLLLATCFVATMLLEWTGTALGNWRWAAEVPGLGMRSANPPAGVGILYIVLDLIVIAITTAQPLSRWRARLLPARG